MPYFIDANECVRKGTKEDPGEIEKCHETHAQAVAHLGALYVHVEDAKEMQLDNVVLERGKLKLPLQEGVWSYKADGQNRWIAITTVAIEDKDDEIYTNEAIDFGIRWCEERNEFPELRVIHLKGLKAGKCDRMQRIGPFAVDEGYYDDTPFGRETRRVVDSGRSKMSRGFSVLKAAGVCPSPSCNTSLTVGAIGLKFLYQCPECLKVNLGRRLKGVRFLEAVPFDFTVTDRPAVPWTMITNKEKSSMTREEIITRLVELGFAKEIVEPVIAELSDEQLVRAKEDNVGDWFKELIETAATKAKEAGGGGPKEVSPGDDGLVTCFKCGSKMKLRLGQQNKETGAVEIEVDEHFMDALGTLIEEKLKESTGMPSEIEVELPGVEERFTKLETVLGELMTVVKEIAKTDAEKLAEMNGGLSDASRTRLTFRFREDGGDDTPSTLPDPSQMLIPTPEGGTVESLSEYVIPQGG